jgi:magnesium chelatase family protein
MPGIISLAHNGVMYLDEMPEYPRSVLECLRQPLEDRVITVTRTKASVEYPASFMLVGSLNPCPCGNYGVKGKVCKCSLASIRKYRAKISGPLLDRIDLKIDVDRVDFLDLANKGQEESSCEIKKRVEKARKIQTERFKGTSVHTNAKMNSKMINEFCKLNSSCEELVKLAFERYKMSARGYTRILKVARTIADLDGSIDIKENHTAEALAYRNIDKFGL